MTTEHDGTRPKLVQERSASNFPSHMGLDDGCIQVILVSALLQAPLGEKSVQKENGNIGIGSAQGFMM